MENASKALIIAGAILLSILLISLGLMVYQQAKNTIGSVNLDAQQIEQFNETFLRYEGTSVSAANVNALIQNVISSNQTAINNNTGAYVGIQFPTVSDATGKKAVHICVNTSKGVVYASLEGDAVKSAVSDVKNTSSGENDKTSSSELCRVATGKTYKVIIGRTNSVVSSILVTAN